MSSVGYDDHPVGLLVEAFLCDLGECALVESAVIHHLHVDMEVSPVVAGTHGSVLHLLPVSLGFVFGHDANEIIGLVVRQCTGIHVGLVVHFLKCLLHLFPCLF